MSGPRLGVAVESAGLDGLNGVVSAHFGRSAAFVIVETDGRRVLWHMVLPNRAEEGHGHCVAPAHLQQLGVTAVIAGGMGRGAVEALAARGIVASGGHAGTVREAVDAFLRRGAQPPTPCAGHHGEGGCSHHHHDGDAAPGA